MSYCYKVSHSLKFSSSYSTYLNENQEILQLFIRNLVARVLKEIKYPSDPKQPQIYLNKCWNTLRAIADSQIYIPEHLKILDDELLPLIALIEQPQAISFDDDILDTLISTAKHSKSIAPNLSQVIKILPKIQEKYEFRVTQLMECYNKFFLYKIDTFADPAQIDQVDNIFDIRLSGSLF